MDDELFVPRLDLEQPFSVRIGSADDVDALLEVEELSQGAPWSRRVFEKEFDLDFSNTWVVEWNAADASAPLAAYLVFWLVHDEVHVLNVVVHPDARRRGLARTLMDELVRVAELAHASMISLEVRVGNEPAQALYRNMGFVPIGRRDNYYADNHEDADVMVLLLQG